MPMWRCPHCGTPQAETARCWVCHRSSTACATCRHFRRSVAAQLGYCGLDRQRLPLRGDEIRGCWDAAEAVPEVEAGRTPVRSIRPHDVDLDRTPVRKLEFVEVRPVAAPGRGRRAAAPGTGPEAATAAGRDEPDAVEARAASAPGRPAQTSWSLWGEADS